MTLGNWNGLIDCGLVVLFCKKLEKIQVFSLVGFFMLTHHLRARVKIQFCRLHLISNIFLKVDIALLQFCLKFTLDMKLGGMLTKYENLSY